MSRIPFSASIEGAVTPERVAVIDRALQVVLGEKIGLAGGVVGRRKLVTMNGDKPRHFFPLRRLAGAERSSAL